MTESFLRELATPLARELEEYILLKTDILASFNGIRIWFERYAGRKKEELSDEDKLIALSLVRDSIIMFVGCFDKSAPLALRVDDIYSADNGGITFFEWLKDIRDSYAAHKFGPFRQCAVGVFVDDAGAVFGTGDLTVIWAGPEASSKDQFLSFISVAGKYVDRKIAEISEQLLGQAKAMKPEELRALKHARLRGVEPHQVRTSRALFRRSIPEGDGT